MSIVRPRVSDGGMVRELAPGDLLAGGENILAGADTVAGGDTLTGAMFATGIIRRTGPTGAYTDTSPTSSDIITAISGNNPAADVISGSSFRLIFQNTVAFAMTLAANDGVALGTGTTTIAASLVREYLITILNASPPITLQTVTTNGNKVLTFVLPAGMTAFPIGPAPNAVNITPGMTVKGTGITAGTKILGITQGQGGITGVVTDTNSTATSTAAGAALTFMPSVLIDGLRSSTL